VRTAVATAKPHCRRCLSSLARRPSRLRPRPHSPTLHAPLYPRSLRAVRHARPACCNLCDLPCTVWHL
jgi:hypothetical protein